MKHQSGELTETMRAEFEDWISQSGTHKRAYDSVVRLWADLNWSESLNRTALNAPETKPVGRRASKGLLPVAVGLMAAAAAVAAFIMQVPTPSHRMPAPTPVFAETLHQTTIGEVREFELEDGSLVTLAGNSTLAVLQMDETRRVELRKGDAYFSVSRNEHSPFTVTTPRLSVSVLGTEFEINTKPNHEEVSVSEGLVEVSTTDGNARVKLSVGERAIVDRETMETATFDPARSANWRSGRLSFVNAPLEELVAETNQYFPGGIYFGDSDVSAFSVTTSFRTDQTETAISGVARSLGLSVVKTDTGALVLVRSSVEK